MEQLLGDLRFAARVLLKDRAFSATALLTLAVCIGANATIFSVVYSVLLRPLAVPEPERLVLLHNGYPGAGLARAANSVPDYYDRLRDLQAFEEQALYNTRGVTLGGPREPQRLLAMVATPSLLRMLEARPVNGRIFTDAESEQGQHRAAVLTYGLWQQLFAGRPDAVGGELRVDGEPHTIVGVLPREFGFLDPEVRLWIPAAFSAEERSDDSRHNNNWSMVGRLRRGATIDQARQQLDALNARNMERFPEFREILRNAGFHSVAVPLQEDVVRGIRGTLYLLWGGVLFVLLIGIVNLTNLALVRSNGRARELATRQALGAGLGRLTRQLVTETVLLTATGGVLGVFLGFWGLSALSRLGLEQLPRGTEVRLDGVAAAFTLGLALVVGLVVASVPTLSLRRLNLSQAVREEGRSGTSGKGTRLLRRTLVVAQVAVAFVLLIGAGLLLASFQRILAIDPGFEPSNVLTARVAPPAARYGSAQAQRIFADRLLERVRALPGVERAGLTSNIPFGGDFSDSVILAEDYTMAPGESLISPVRFRVSPGYIDAMGIAIVRGRGFLPTDTDTAPPVIIIDEKLARRFWGDRDPVGRRMFQPDSPQDLTRPGPNARWYTVVGVVSEIRISGLVETTAPVGAYYFPIAQQPARSLTLAIRSRAGAPAIVPALRQTLAAIDPELPLYGILSMRERMEQSLIDRRTPMILATTFAAIATFLAAVGIYGVLGYQVAQRTREIAIRMALGSDANGVFRLILSEGLVLLGTGLAIGAAGARSMRAVLNAQLYGVSATDPVVISAVAAVMGVVALVACAVPARRAARIDPVVALNS